MMHSRGFVLSENQALAGQARTPGPSRSHASPTRKNLTTGKRALSQSSKLLGQEMASVGPKQLFQDLMSSKSPVKALGDRNAARTPGPSRPAHAKQDASLRKGKGAPRNNAELSPAKTEATAPSPRKHSTANALRPINGKQRLNTEVPFTKPGQSSSHKGPVEEMKTPAPTQLTSKARTMSRQNSFVTPAANVGRAGQIKARMGEILDAEMGLSLQKADNATEQSTEQPSVQLTEEELYPEIEYMPPSMHAKHPVFEFPDELEDLPRAKQLGAQLSTFSAIGFQAAGPQDLSDVDMVPMEPAWEDNFAPQASTADSDDDDHWPDVPVIDAVAALQPSASRIGQRTAAKNVRPATEIRSATREAGRASQATATSTATAGRTPSSKAAGQPVARSAGLQRSIASAPGRRVMSPSSTASRIPPAARPNAATARSAVRSAAATKAATTRAARIAPGTTQSKLHSTAPKVAKTMLNPKLVDFVDDDLGKQTAAVLERMDAEEDLEALELDLGEECNAEA